ncbi:MAG: hypothetical protein V3U57_09860 [Robiginitomaculum sp.]
MSIGKIHKERIVSLIIAFMFVFIKADGIAHASKHGNEPHKHNGILCALSVAEKHENDVCIPPAEIKLAIIGQIWLFTRQNTVLPQDRTRIIPSTRGPPNT